MCWDLHVHCRMIVVYDVNYADSCIRVLYCCYFLYYVLCTVHLSSGSQYDQGTWGVTQGTWRVAYRTESLNG